MRCWSWRRSRLYATGGEVADVDEIVAAIAIALGLENGVEFESNEYGTTLFKSFKKGVAGQARKLLSRLFLISSLESLLSNVVNRFSVCDVNALFRALLGFVWSEECCIRA